MNAAQATGRRARGHSLRGRLLAAVLGTSVTAWLVSLAIVLGVAWHEAGEVFDQALEEGARLVLVLGAESAGQRMPAPRLREGDEPLKLELHYQLVRNGVVVHRAEEAPARPFVEQTTAKKGEYTVRVEGRYWRVHVRSDPATGLQAQVGQPWEERLELLEEVAEKLAWPALLLLLLLGTVCWWLIRRLLAPLERTAAGIAAKSPDDLSPVAATGQPREVQPILDALNALLLRLSDALAAERRFTADAAHELRTPLAALRMRVQLIERRQGLQRVQDLQGVEAADLQALREDADRCTALIESLLALARLDPAQQALAPEPVDLATLFDSLDTQQAAARGITVLRQVDASQLQAQPVLLATALRGLIDNAVRYGQAGGRVVLRSAPLPGGAVQIVVADDGPGVPEAERARLGERFFRVLGSGQPGHGLGLSIVKRIAALHGATLRFDTGLDGRGLAAVLEFPQEFPQG